MREYLRQPLPAALIAAVATWFFISFRDKMQGVESAKNSRYAKPALFVAVIVYAIVYVGQHNAEPLAA